MTRVGPVRWWPYLMAGSALVGVACIVWGQVADDWTLTAPGVIVLLMVALAGRRPHDPNP